MNRRFDNIEQDIATTSNPPANPSPPQDSSHSLIELNSLNRIKTNRITTNRIEFTESKLNISITGDFFSSSLRLQCSKWCASCSTSRARFRFRGRRFRFWRLWCWYRRLSCRFEHSSTRAYSRGDFFTCRFEHWSTRAYNRGGFFTCSYSTCPIYYIQRNCQWVWLGVCKFLQWTASLWATRSNRGKASQLHA